MALGLVSQSNFYPEILLRVPAKMAQFLSGQCYGFSKKFENFYPDWDLGSKGTFRGPITLLTLVVLFLTSMATNELHAILRGKRVIAITAWPSTSDRHPDIEVEGDVDNGQQRTRKLYSVQLSVADSVVAKSPRTSVLKWVWNTNNHMWVLVL